MNLKRGPKEIANTQNKHTCHHIFYSKAKNIFKEIFFKEQ